VNAASGWPHDQERRRAPRFAPGDLAVPVAVAGARLLQIGAYGLMIEAPLPVPQNSGLRFNLLVNGSKGLVDGHVRSCRPLPDSRRRSWGVGVEFAVMRPEDRERLDRALAQREARG
jgi:hypothetical protein